MEKRFLGPVRPRNRVVQDHVADVTVRPPVGKITDDGGVCLLTPDGCQMTLSTCCGPDEVKDPLLSRPVRPAIDPRRDKPIAVADDEIIATLRAHELEVER